MKRYLILLILSTFVWLFPGKSSATHIAGGELTIHNVGGDTFQVTLILYRDCSGVVMPAGNRTVTINSSCTSSQTLTLFLQNAGGTEVSQLCPDSILQSQCNGGSLPGMEAYIYQNTVVLGTHCADYTISYREANRNTSINVFNSSAFRFYIDATLNTLLYPNNSTPIFTAQPIPYVCLNQTVNYNYGVVENQGDSLSYSLVSARTTLTNFSSPFNMIYNSGYSGTSPIQGITIDSQTGELSFSPSMPAGNYIVVVQVSEYNGLGQLISTIQRDIQFVVVNCSNTIPDIPTAISNLTSSGGQTSQTDSLEISTVVGESLCFDLVFSDTNVNDTLFVTSNVTSALPGATMVVTGTNPVTATVCWTVPPGMNTNNTVIFQVSDSACPVSGVNSVAVNIIVPQPQNVSGILVTTPVSCNNICDATAYVTAIGGVGPFSFQWTPEFDPNGQPNFTGQGTDSIYNLCDGTYLLIITDLGDPDPSTNTWDTIFTIADPPPIFVTNTIVNHDDCDTTTCTGSINAFVFGGTAPYSFNWSNGSSGQTVTNLCYGFYGLTVTDANNCTAEDTFLILEPTPFVFVVDSTDSVSCFGGNDGAIYTHVELQCGTSTNGCSTTTSSQIGTGTQTNTGATYPAPYGNRFDGARHQMLFRASELQAAGVEAGIISSVAFDVAVVGNTTTYKNFTVKIGCTNATDLSGGWEGSLTDVIYPTTHTVTPGWNTHNFDVDYVWDGASNIVVEICFVMDNSSVNGNSQTRFTPTTFQSVRYYRANNEPAVCSNGNTTSLSVNRPNIRFGHCEMGMTYTWMPPPAAGQDTNIVTNLTAQTYFITVTSNDGCSETATATVGQPSQLVSTITLDSAISCNGVCDAQISLNITGGTPPYTINWDSGLPPDTVHTGLCAGTYNVTITDAKGCTETQSITITEPPVLVATTSIDTVISCNGVCDGVASVTVSGGTPPYMIVWSDGFIGPVHNGLCAGTYNITVTDANGCTVNTSVTLTDPPVLTVTINEDSAIQCNGDLTGQLTATAAGGTPQYTYAWSNGANTATISGLGAGTYTVSVTDANGCVVTASHTLTEPDSISITVDTLQNVSCFGVCDGSITVSLMGGTAPLTATWSNGFTGLNPSALCAGAYTVTVTDANGCTATENYTITEPAEIVLQQNIVDSISCNGVCDGKVYISVVSGGTAPFTFAWPAGVIVVNDTGTALCGNTTYIVTVTDANGCQALDTINLTEPSVLDVTISLDQAISCGGTCDAQLTATGSGGNAPYTYTWSNGMTGSTISGICAGVISVTVTDASGCTDTASLNVTEPNPIIGQITQTASILCNGDSTAALLASASGGTAPYAFVWSTGATTAAISNLPAGTYTVTITDANTCDTTVSFTVTEPDTIGISFNVDQAISCSGVCDGALTALVTGGTPGYTILWSTGATGPSQTALCAGVYTVTVTDANGCTNSASFTLTEPPAMALTITESNPISCNGVCDGELTAVVQGCTNCTYVWSNGSTGAVNGSLCAGTYSVTATNASGCTVTGSYTIVEPPAIAISLSIIDSISCNGVCDGTISATVSGGTPPLDVVWPSGDTALTLGNLCAGTYTVTVYDANNCSVTSTIMLTEPDSIDITLNITQNISCNGVCDGEVTATVIGGTPPLSYAWSNGATTPVIANLCAGTYYLTVTDANMCSKEDSVVITEPDPITPTPSITDATCGACDGQIDLMPVTGGDGGPYTFAWSGITPNPGNVSLVDSLCAGTYTVTITDGSGCSETFTYPVSNVGGPTAATFSMTEPTCNGDCDGSMTVTPTGGTMPYSYAWSTGNAADTLATVDNLCAGIYFVTITDANGCVLIATDTLGEPDPVLNTIVVTDANCSGVCDGTATVTSTGGTPGYTYIWSNGMTGSSITGLCAGTYMVTTTDLNGCSRVDTIVVNQPGGMTITITETQSITCNGVCDGQLTATVSGGSMPYSYAWSTGNAADTFSVVNNLCAGTYTVTVTDANGCTDTASFTISEPAPISATPAITDATCGVCDGIIDLSNVSGGNGGPYSYQWSNGETTALIDSLCAGTYSVTVTDNAGCTAVFTYPVSNTGGAGGATFTQVMPTCNGDCDGSLTVMPTGGTPPYSYVWSTGIPADTFATVNNLCAGIYFVTITDASGCSFIATDTLNEPDTISNSAAIVNLTCNGVCGGSISLTTSGGTGPYTYTWSNGATGAAVINLCAGTYTVTTTDANGCTRIDNYTITEPTPVVVTITISQAISCNGICDGEMIASATGGTAPYTFLWSNGTTTPAASGLCAGSYTVTVTDANGCTSTGTMTITEPAVITMTPIVTDANCGVCDGIIDASNVSGGDGGPYTYLWSNGNTTATVNGLCSGTYTVTITDGSGCSNVFTVPVNDIGGPVNSTIAKTDITCNGVCNGTMTVTPAGGTAPYTYLWSTGDTTASVSGLCAGVYFVTVTDANGCDAILSDTIVEPAPVISNEAITNTSCNAICDGEIALSPSGGTSPYSYMWSNGTIANPATGLCAGTYMVTITDGNGCQKLDTFTVVEPAPLTLTLTTTDASCFNTCDGTAQVLPSGGTPPYSVLWSTGDTTAAVTGLCAGQSYGVTVTDSTGCSNDTTFIVGSPPAIVLDSVQVVNPDCGMSNGSITAFASGGTGSLQYIWNGTINMNPLTNVPAGNYTLTIMDATGCSFTTVIPLSNVGGPVVVVNTTPASCNGDCTGTATAMVTGGTGPYSYVWSNGDTTNPADSLCAGPVNVLVTDLGTGCVSADTGTVGQVQGINLMASVIDNYNCNGVCNGQITTSVSGGNGPYTYIWSTGDTTDAISGLCAGTYGLTVTSSDGCSDSAMFTVVDVPGMAIAFDSVVNTSCNNTNDGAIFITVSGGVMPYNYAWTGPGFASNQEDINNLLPGTYIIVVTDSLGCSITDSSMIVPETDLIVSVPDIVKCGEQDSVVIVPNVSGHDSTATYQWYNEAGSPVGNDSTLKVPFPADTAYYSLEVVSGGCSSADTGMVLPGQIPDVDAGPDVEIVKGEVVEIGGNPTTSWGGSTIIWSPGGSLNDSTDANPIASPDITTVYTVFVTNILGCSNSDQVVVTVKPAFDVPNGFTPNGDGNNDVWELDFLEKYPDAKVEVYNRWGQLMFESIGYDTPWDGKYKGKDLPVGTYYYVIDIGRPDITEPLTGPLTIMR